MSKELKRPNRKDYINKATTTQLVADLELYIDQIESKLKEAEEQNKKLKYGNEKRQREINILHEKLQAVKDILMSDDETEKLYHERNSFGID